MVGMAPPEVITGRLMSGAGAGPMAASAASFGLAAVAYEASSDALMAHLAQLMTVWQGPTATSVAASVAEFMAWLRLTQVQLTTAATRTGAQATAFTTAYATMAQMVEIVDNRVTTAVLHATNFLGFNTIPIGIREGEYTAMTLQDVAVQNTYEAATVANTTFEPFVPPTQMVLADFVPTPLVEQFGAAAMNAVDNLTLAATAASSALGILQSGIGEINQTVMSSAALSDTYAQQGDAQRAMQRFNNANDRQQQGDQMAQQLGQQLVQQIPQQASQIGQMGSQLTQLPQQALQQGQQIGQQFASQIGNMMNQVAPEHRVDNPGFFDTQASSPTLDRLSAGGAGGGFAAAFRVAGLGGLSGASTGYRFPADWDAAPVAPAAPVTPSSAPMAGGPAAVAGRGMAGAVRPQRKSEPKTTKPSGTELVPVWGGPPVETDTVTAGALASENEKKQEGAA